jgi:hypothetical protein
MSSRIDEKPSLSKSSLLQAKYLLPFLGQLRYRPRFLRVCLQEIRAGG